MQKTTIDYPEGNQGLDHLLFFSDAVMAIALTLLTVDLRLPETSQFFTYSEFVNELGALVPKLLSFLISSMVISIYWVSHHRYFKYFVNYDSRLIGLNLIFLLFIAIIPFIASLMGQYYYLPIVGMIYAGSVAFTGFSMSAIWLYASSKHRSLLTELGDDFIRVRGIILIVGPSIFLLSIPLGLINSLLLIAARWLSPIISFVNLRKLKTKENLSPLIRHQQNDSKDLCVNEIRNVIAG